MNDSILDTHNVVLHDGGIMTMTGKGNFSDDHLEQFKKTLQDETYATEDFWPFKRWHLIDLVQRLDHAEKVCHYAHRWIVSVNPNTDIEPLLTEWLNCKRK